MDEKLREQVQGIIKRGDLFFEEKVEYILTLLAKAHQAGMKEVADWGNSNIYFHSNHDLSVWQAFLASKGLK